MWTSSSGRWSRPRRAAAASRAQEADLLATAVRLYRGDLLEGVYDDWATPDRERLRERFLKALERLADLTMSRGDYEAALTHARRLAQHDPMREEAHQRVMRLAVLLGRHTDAIRQYELCRRILDEELGEPPSLVTRQIYEATVAERETGHPIRGMGLAAPLFEPAGQVPFVGREQERSLLLQRLDAALDGHGGLVLLEGEAGVGKTRLLAEVVEDARWRGMDVLWGRSSPSGGRPYAPLAEALVAGLSQLRARQLAQRLETVLARAPGSPGPVAGPSGRRGRRHPAAPRRRAGPHARGDRTGPPHPGRCSPATGGARGRPLGRRGHHPGPGARRRPDRGPPPRHRRHLPACRGPGAARGLGAAPLARPPALLRPPVAEPLLAGPDRGARPPLPRSLGGERRVLPEGASARPGASPCSSSRRCGRSTSRATWRRPGQTRPKRRPTASTFR